MTDKPDLFFSYDIGYQSVGWAVLNIATHPPDVKGAGVLLFNPETCQNKQRTGFRRARRNIAARRNRIDRIRSLLDQQGIISREETEDGGHPFPWLLATQALSCSKKLGARELWHVIRWYAHNRGYDGNALWSDVDDGGEDIKKVQAARELMTKYGTTSMAATICACLGVDPNQSRNPRLTVHVKGLRVAFPREVVVNELAKLLQSHAGHVPGVNDALVLALCKDATTMPLRNWQKPKRYRGGYLFGQFVPRFDNRAITTCRISGAKCPSKDCAEYYRYRWAMLLANLRVQTDRKNPRPLDAKERAEVHQAMKTRGYLTKKELIKCVEQATGATAVNIDSYFMTPEMEKALVLDPVMKTLNSEKLKHLVPLLPDPARIRLTRKLRKDQKVCLAEVRDWMTVERGDVTAFDAQMAAQVEKSKKRKNSPDIETCLRQCLTVSDRASGRAPYARPLLIQAFDAVMAGRDPKSKGGPLEETREVVARQAELPLAKKTNNQLVRHRLLMLERLFNDMVSEYADGDGNRIKGIACEVVRDLTEFSGMTPKEVEKTLNAKLRHHRSVSEFLENELARMTNPPPVSGGLIRKARIADDLGWKCPYTGQTYSVAELARGTMDLEHIIPRSLRPSDSLESLVLTYREINEWKGARTAMQFIRDEQGNPIPGLPNLTILTEQRYRELVDRLHADRLRDPRDDYRRRETRKALLLTDSYDKRDRDFLPGELSVTSHLNKLAGMHLRRLASGNKRPPAIVHLPGSVTAAVRREWNLMGALCEVVPETLQEGRLRPKHEIREITHLHHAVDAITLGLAATLIPADGRVWELMSKRRLSPEEARELQACGAVQVGTDRSWRLTDLPKSIHRASIEKLGEKRIYQHVPRKVAGLKVDQNIWRVVSAELDASGQVLLRQQAPRDAKSGQRPDDKWKKRREFPGKLLGGKPTGKLSRIKGALIVNQNFGVTLTDPPIMLPHAGVWQKLQEIRATAEKPVAILRRGEIIDVPQGRYAGRWRIRSIKNNANHGIAIDMTPVDTVATSSKMAKINVLLKSLIASEMRLLSTSLTGG